MLNLNFLRQPDPANLQKHIQEESVKQAVDRAHKDISALSSMIDTRDEYIKYLEKENSRLKTDNRNLRQENDRLKHLNRDSSSGRSSFWSLPKPKPKPRIKLVSCEIIAIDDHNGPFLLAVEEMKRKLVETLNHQSVRLDLHPHHTSAEGSTVPVILPCLVSGRIGTDTDRAFKVFKTKVNGRLPKDLIFMLFHHRAEHEAQSVTNSRSLVSSEIRNAARYVVDVAFWAGQGVYPCDLNNKGMLQMASFLHQFIVEIEDSS